MVLVTQWGISTSLSRETLTSITHTWPRCVKRMARKVGSPLVLVRGALSWSRWRHGKKRVVCTYQFTILCYFLFTIKYRPDHFLTAHHGTLGKLEKISCNVRFLYVTPKDTQKYPYALWISYGIHSHPPPPYNRTPIQVQDEIMELIRRSDSMTLTAGTTLSITQILFWYMLILVLGSFLRSQALQQFLADSGVTRIGQIHPTLINRDRIQVWIERQRLLSCPLGTGFNGNTNNVLYLPSVHDVLIINLFQPCCLSF